LFYTIEDFYQPSSYRTSDGDDEDEENDRLVAFPGRKNNIPQRVSVFLTHLTGYSRSYARM
jgi:hypothetical protein